MTYFPKCEGKGNFPKSQIKLERAVDEAPSQIPTLKFLTTHSTHKSHPEAWPWQQIENSVQYVFYLLFVRTHKKFGIKIFEIDMLMIFDLAPRSSVWP